MLDASRAPSVSRLDGAEDRLWYRTSGLACQGVRVPNTSAEAGADQRLPSTGGLQLRQRTARSTERHRIGFITDRSLAHAHEGVQETRDYPSISGNSYDLRAS